MEILILDDEPSNVSILQEVLEEENHRVQAFTSPIMARDFLKESQVDLIISDLKMPEMDGINFYDECKQIASNTPFILITAYATVQTAVQLIKKGVFDYLTKPLQLENIKNLLHRTEIHLKLKKYSQQIKTNSVENLSIIGDHPSIKSTIKLIQQIAPTNSNVLILGESGTGKEMMARKLHLHSNRTGEFVSVNCGAIPKNLIESTLFGHMEGAFTGAEKTQPGKLEAAKGGTIFLDEIGELPIEQQVKLLRVLSAKEFEKVGSSTPQKLECRIVAATNQNLKNMIKENLFREDLYYRLNVIEIQLLPIKERHSDLITLFAYFANLSLQKNNMNYQSIDDSVVKYLLNYPWPGNIRELKNCADACCILAIDGKLEGKNFPPHIVNYFKIHQNENEPQLTMQEIELRAIESTLELVNQNRRRAAEILGISERTIYRKLGENYQEEEYDDEKND